MMKSDVMKEYDTDFAMQCHGKSLRWNDVVALETELRQRTRKCMFFDNEHQAPVVVDAHLDAVRCSRFFAANDRSCNFRADD